MTSSSTFMPFRVNDLPCEIMRWLEGAPIDRVILFPVDKWPIQSPMLLGSLQTQKHAEGLITIKERASIQQPGLTSQAPPTMQGCLPYSPCAYQTSDPSAFSVLCGDYKRGGLPYSQISNRLPSRAFSSCEFLHHVTYEWVRQSKTDGGYWVTDTVFRGLSKHGTNKLCLGKDGRVPDREEAEQYGKYAVLKRVVAVRCLISQFWAWMDKYETHTQSWGGDREMI